MQTVFERSFSLADLMFGAAKTPSFVSFIETTESGRDVKTILTRWAGGRKEGSQSAMYGPWKAFSLLAKGYIEGITTTPIENFKNGCPFKGGYRDFDLITSVSGWENDRVDLVLALLLYWSLMYETRLHHVGFKHSNREELEKNIEQDESRLGARAMQKVASDHERYYIRVSNQSPNGVYWVEHQLFPNDCIPGMHWDFTTSNPEHMIRFIANFSRLKAEIWPREENSPCGRVMVPDSNGTLIAIMARPVWSKVEDW